MDRGINGSIGPDSFDTIEASKAFRKLYKKANKGGNGEITARQSIKGSPDSGGKTENEKAEAKKLEQHTTAYGGSFYYDGNGQKGSVTKSALETAWPGLADSEEIVLGNYFVDHEQGEMVPISNNTLEAFILLAQEKFPDPVNRSIEIMVILDNESISKAELIKKWPEIESSLAEYFSDPAAETLVFIEGEKTDLTLKAYDLDTNTTQAAIVDVLKQGKVTDWLKQHYVNVEQAATTFPNDDSGIKGEQTSFSYATNIFGNQYLAISQQTQKISYEHVDTERSTTSIAYGYDLGLGFGLLNAAYFLSAAYKQTEENGEQVASSLAVRADITPQNDDRSWHVALGLERNEGYTHGLDSRYLSRSEGAKTLNEPYFIFSSSLRYNPWFSKDVTAKAEMMMPFVTDHMAPRASFGAEWRIGDLTLAYSQMGATEIDGDVKTLSIGYDF
jgi:hypothetical protein